MIDAKAKLATITRMIALAYYDGPTGGLVKLSSLGMEHTFIFKLMSWDETQDSRVFALAELADKTALDRVAAVAGQPRWPIWVPDWRFKSDEEKTKADGVVEQIMALKTPYQAVMCAPDDMSTAEIWSDLSPTHRALLKQFSQSEQIQSFDDWRGLCRL
jgi:hypothetical protein